MQSPRVNVKKINKDLAVEKKIATVPPFRQISSRPESPLSNCAAPINFASPSSHAI